MAPKKSFTTSSSAAGRAWLRQHRWPSVQANIPVRLHFRDLGSHLVIAGGAVNPTLSERLRAAVLMCVRLRNDHFNHHNKIIGLRTKVFPAALYGVESAPVPIAPMAALRSAVISIFYNNSRTRSIIGAFEVLDKHELDPYVSSIWRRFSLLRRVLSRSDDLKTKAANIIRHHISNLTPGTIDHDHIIDPDNIP